MATRVPDSPDSPISPLLNTTFTVHKTTPVVGSSSLPPFDQPACNKYLLSLRRRIKPFLDLLPHNDSQTESTAAAGAWTARHHDGLTIHSITFPLCKFILLVRRQQATTTTQISDQERRLVVFTRANRQLHDVFVTWLEMYFDIIVRPVKLSSTFILRFVQDHVLACHRNQSTTPVRLDFTTGIPQLKIITLAFEPDDVIKFARPTAAAIAGSSDDGNSGVLARMLDHMENTTGLKFAQIDIARAACSGGVIGADGRIKFIVGSSDASNWHMVFVETWVANLAGLVWTA
ncbi:hypothetical protein V1525DRAFT_400777 [Lipomyces kononenkoae]|uniref:Uncharacterized protein n=1 Tax=Lipomyces kononenkoae TaxID=34357 RepID=A0ACC3T4H2_LIPKO